MDSDALEAWHADQLAADALKAWRADQLAADALEAWHADQKRCAASRAFPRVNSPSGAGSMRAIAQGFALACRAVHCLRRSFPSALCAACG